jgi:hypothetical protein
VAKEKLSKRELERQIDVSLFEHSRIETKLSPPVRELHPDINLALKMPIFLSSWDFQKFTAKMIFFKNKREAQCIPKRIGAPSYLDH